VAGFLAGTAPVIRAAVEAGDPVLVVVPGPLRQELGPAAAAVSFADVAGPGDNPARLLAVWQAFALAHAGAARLWGIGETIYPGRSPAGLAECHLHEALLNVAFGRATPLRMLCPYDLQALPADVIRQACRTHPFIARGEDREPSGAFRPVDLASPFARPLPGRPAGASRMPFGAAGFGCVRALVAGHAGRAGLSRGPAADLVLAVHEIAVNSVRHGGGHGELRIWADSQSLVCEVSGGGHITAPLAGRLPPVLDGHGGAGLWTASQVCDLLQIHSTAAGTVIRVSQRLGPASRS